MRISAADYTYSRDTRLADINLFLKKIINV